MIPDLRTGWQSRSWHGPTRALRRLWLACLRGWNEAVTVPYRLAALTERLSPYLRDISTVLDVGTSAGRLARRLMEAAGCHILGIDVWLQPCSHVEACHYDGRTFPIASGAFDCVMMIDVLHHAQDIEAVFGEACRVSRRYLLVKDHYWQTEADRALLRLSDYLGNAPYGIALPNRYLRLEEWMGLFARHGLGLICCDRWRLHPLDPCMHIVAKLQKQDASLA